MSVSLSCLWFRLLMPMTATGTPAAIRTAASRQSTEFSPTPGHLCYACDITFTSGGGKNFIYPKLHRKRRHGACITPILVPFGQGARHVLWLEHLAAALATWVQIPNELNLSSLYGGGYFVTSRTVADDDDYCPSHLMRHLKFSPKDILYCRMIAIMFPAK